VIRKSGRSKDTDKEAHMRLHPFSLLLIANL